MKCVFSLIRRCLLVGLAVYWLALAIGTHLPSTSRMLPDANDKVLHMLAFGGLTFLLSFVVMGLRPTVRAACVTLLAVFVYAAGDEATQRFVPGRVPSILDWIADLVGAVAGWGVYWIVQRWIALRRLDGWNTALRRANDAA